METVSFMRSLAQGFQNLYYVSNRKLCLHQSCELIWKFQISKNLTQSADYLQIE